MAGLLDALNSDEGMQALGLLAAAGPSATPMSFGQRLFGAMQQDQARRTEAEDRKMRQQMQQMQMQQLEEAAAGRRKAAEQEQQRASYLGAIDSSQGPPMQMSVPRALASGLSLPEIGALMPKQEDPMAGIDKVSPKDYTPESLAMFVQTRNPAVLRAAPKDQGPDEFERALRLAGIDPASPQGRQMATARAQKMATHQPGTKVEVNTGQRGLDNTLKLRGDFRSEPVYKAHQEMQSAHSQIQQALKQASPAGDLAGATKIMKLLDPGSVVRESELAIAMAAAGKLDRLQNYVQMKISGESLTPKQRVDFEALAGELHSAASQAYNAKRMEYENTGKRYGLDPAVLGSPSAQMPKPAAKTGLPEMSAIDAEIARRKAGGK